MDYAIVKKSDPTKMWTGYNGQWLLFSTPEEAVEHLNEYDENQRSQYTVIPVKIMVDRI